MPAQSAIAYPSPLIKCAGAGARRGSGMSLRSLRLPLLLTTHPILFLRFPFSDALLVPDRPHGKLAVGARYAAEVPSGEVGKHRVALESQPSSQGCGVQDLVVLWHLYPV